MLLKVNAQNKLNTAGNLNFLKKRLAYIPPEKTGMDEYLSAASTQLSGEIK